MFKAGCIFTHSKINPANIQIMYCEIINTGLLQEIDFQIASLLYFCSKYFRNEYN